MKLHVAIYLIALCFAQAVSAATLSPQQQQDLIQLQAVMTNISIVADDLAYDTAVLKKFAITSQTSDEDTMRYFAASCFMMASRKSLDDNLTVSLTYFEKSADFKSIAAKVANAHSDFQKGEKALAGFCNAGGADAQGVAFKDTNAAIQVSIDTLQDLQRISSAAKDFVSH